MYKVQLEPFQNVTQNAKAIASFPRLLGNAVPQITLDFGGGVTKALMANIRLKANQKTLWELTGAQLDIINKYNAHPATVNQLSLMFQEPRARDIVGQHAGTIDLSRGYANFGLEVDLGAVGAAPTLQAWAHMMPSLAKQGAGLAQLAPLARVLLPTPITLNAAVADLPINIAALQQGGYLIKRIFFFHTGQLSAVRFVRDSVDQYEKIANALNSFWQDEQGHDPQVNCFVLDFIEDDNLSEALRTNRSDGSVANNVLKVTTAGAETMTVIVDALAVPGLV